MLGHWQLMADLEFDEEALGFVYLVHDRLNQKFYLGKKQKLTHKKLPPLKGYKRSRRVWKNTNWKSYTGSSDYLNTAIEEHGKDNFDFYILGFCDSKSELTYFETKLLLDFDALYSDQFYNVMQKGITLGGRGSVDLVKYQSIKDRLVMALE